MTHPGQELIRSLKVTAGGIGPELSIVVGAPPQSILRPVATQRNRLSQTDIRFLTVWRNRFVGSFLTEFEATEDRTASWLVNVVGPKLREDPIHGR